MTTLGPSVGIDLSKAELVVAEHPSGERWTERNDDAGIERLRCGDVRAQDSWLSSSCRPSLVDARHGTDSVRDGGTAGWPATGSRL